MQLLIFTILLIIYFVIHSALASHSVKNILIDKWIAKKYYRLAFNAVAIISLIPILFAFITIESANLFVSPHASTIGLTLAGIGILVLLIALSQYNLSEFSGIQQLRTEKNLPPQTLKTNGFNAIVRHPLYFAGLMIIWGAFLYKPNIKMVIVASIATLYLYFGTKLEEQKLLIEFGEEYKIYQNKVAMLIPFLK